MRHLSLALCAGLAMSAAAQNLANITLNNGDVTSYPTTSIQSINLNNDRSVTVNPLTGAPVTINGVARLSFIKNEAGCVPITEAGGWFETAYVEWQLPDGGFWGYNVYVSEAGTNEYTKLDDQLVRRYADYGRADIPGLKAGSYTLKVVPVINGAEDEARASETSPLTVVAHDRGGFAHFNYSEGVGAYNNDGTLKAGAKVIYVDANTAKTVKTDVVTSSKGATTTCEGMQTILDAYQKGYDSTPIAFRIIGRIANADMDHFSSSAEGLQIKGKNNTTPMNITIEGIGCDATFHGFGMLLRNAVSVEIRNLGIMWQLDDGISCDTDNAHCWIHNCDVFYGQPGGASDQVKGDGAFDVKSDSQYVTFSYNHFWDTGKSSLCGMKSESGPNWITYHHNWFDHSDSRHPRVRTMSVHVYNNYFDGVAKYGIGSTTGSDVFVEGNYFRDCKYPILTSKQGSDIATDSKGTFSGEDGGSVKSFGNIMRGCYYYRPWSETNNTQYDAWEAPTRDAQMPQNLTALQGGATYSNWDTDPSLMYEYTCDAAAEVPSVIKGVYGAGRINHGDFRWRFNNNTQDENSDVITALSSALRVYDSWLVGYFDGTVVGNSGAGSVNPGGDSTEGDEFPKGDYNRVDGNPGGGSGDQPVEIDPANVFIGAADGGYFRFDASATEQVAAWVADGTFTGGKHAPTFTSADYWDGTGSYQIDKSGGTLVIRCPGVSVFKAQLLRTGSYGGKVEKSTDGVNYTEVASISGSKGVKEVDWGSVLKSDGQVWVRITNSSSGSLNILGLTIVK